jgi:hypothetical protein
MEIALIHNKAVLSPRRLRIESFARFTNHAGLHVEATNLETGEPEVLRHSEISIPSEYTGGQRGEWCAYPLADTDLSQVGGFVPPELSEFHGRGFVGLAHVQEALQEWQVIQGREMMPPNAYYAVLRVTDYTTHVHVDLIGARWSSDREKEFVPPIALNYYEPETGAFYDNVEPDYSVTPIYEGGKKIVDIAVIIPGVDGPTQDVSDNDIGMWAKPLTLKQIAQRLHHVADHLEQIAESDTPENYVADVGTGGWVPTEGWEDSDFGLGINKVLSSKLGAVQRALKNLAPHCGREHARISEISGELNRGVQAIQDAAGAELIAGAVGYAGTVPQPPLDWAAGATIAASHVRAAARTLAAQPQIASPFVRMLT